MLAHASYCSHLPVWSLGEYPGAHLHSRPFSELGAGAKKSVHFACLPHGKSMHALI